jgi:hypothetical protein
MAKRLSEQLAELSGDIQGIPRNQERHNRRGHDQNETDDPRQHAAFAFNRPALMSSGDST